MDGVVLYNMGDVGRGTAHIELLSVHCHLGIMGKDDSRGK